MKTTAKKSSLVIVLIVLSVFLLCGGCSHDNHIAPRHIDNLFLNRLELDKDIPVILQAGTVEEPVVVSTKSIRFEQDGALVKASLKIEWESIVDDTWQATLKFQCENGSTLARSDVFFKTSKIIEKYAGLHSESLHFALGPFGPLTDLPKVKHFLLTIQPAREQLTAAVQVGGGDFWGPANNGLQIRLIIPKTEGEQIPVLTPEKYTARLEVRNTGGQLIRFLVDNGRGASYSAKWLPGLYIAIRSQDGAEYDFLRADDSWYRNIDTGVSSVPPMCRHLKPRKTASFEIRLDRLVDFVEETNLLNLRGHFELRPVISIPDNHRWHGKVVGEYIPVTIRPPAVQVEAGSVSKTR
jgi:hypothetical protein